MMNAVPILILTTTTVVLGKWSNNEHLNQTIVISLVVLIVFISILEQSSPELAKGLATIALVGTLLKYGPTLFSNLKGGHK